MIQLELETALTAMVVANVVSCILYGIMFTGVLSAYLYAVAVGSTVLAVLYLASKLHRLNILLERVSLQLEQ